MPRIKAKPSGKRVLVVGAGPSGLSAAHHLTLMGHEVEGHEAGPLTGGMMHFGIPAYRLPRDILEGETRRIENMGVDIVLDHKVEDLQEEIEGGGFDAAFVAVGAHLSRRVDIPGRDAGPRGSPDPAMVRGPSAGGASVRPERRGLAKPPRGVGADVSAGGFGWSALRRGGGN